MWPFKRKKRQTFREFCEEHCPKVPMPAPLTDEQLYPTYLERYRAALREINKCDALLKEIEARMPVHNRRSQLGNYNA